MSRLMTHPANKEDLERSQNVTLILQIVLDENGQLIYGEIHDATRTYHKRFRGESGLLTTVRDWLIRSKSLF